MNKLVKTTGLSAGTHDCGFDEKRLNPKRGRGEVLRYAPFGHTARRSFATNAAGYVPLPSIQAITDTAARHKLRRYLKLDAEEKAVIALKDFKGIIKI